MRSTKRNRTGFTLVELLVVIGIIAVLVGILLPSLNKARRAARTVQCSSNMRQIAMAMIQYAGANKGVLPATQAGVLAGPYPTGWWWPNELVRGKFILAPSVYGAPNANVNQKLFSSGSVFKCPEGIDENDLLNQGGGDFPTDAKNNDGVIGNDAQCALQGLGIISWYMTVSRVQTASNLMPSGLKISPFVEFSSTATADDGALGVNNPGFKRTLAMAKRGAELVMIVEASNNNWMNQAASVAYPSIWCGRMGARHGQKSADGANAYTNLAFFDGHVALFPTAPFVGIAPSGIPGAASTDNNLVSFTRDTVFYVNRQRGLR